MFNFQTILIIMACSVPVVSLMMVLPKLKLKKKEKKPESKEDTKTLEDLKKEEKTEQTVETPKPIEVKRTEIANDISTEDFKSYLNNRKPFSKPSRIDLPDDFIDRTTPFSRRQTKKDQPKSLAEEIKTLSPELKAILFTGALDKKDFD